MTTKARLAKQAKDAGPKTWWAKSRPEDAGMRQPVGASLPWKVS